MAKKNNEIKGEELQQAFTIFTKHFQPHNSGEVIFLDTFEIIRKIQTFYPGCYINAIDINKCLENEEFEKSMDPEDTNLKWRVELVSN